VFGRSSEARLPAPSDPDRLPFNAHGRTVDQTAVDVFESFADGGPFTRTAVR